jgi:SPP1 family predicted phage head-tail adaptor
MKAGKLRKRIQIQALPASPAMNSFNEPTFADWATAATVWGSVEPLSGRELVFAAQVLADATHMVTIRYYRGLTAKMRFLYVDDATGANRIFNIAFIKDVAEGHREMQCLCNEAAP